MSDSIRIENFEQVESLISDLEGGILAAINAEILSSKGKPKKCVVVLSYFGIHILRPVIFARTWKIKLFVSELNINSIEYIDENTKIINSGNETLHLKSKDIDLVENTIITVHSTLMQDSNVHLELNFINYPKEKPRYPIRTEKNPRIQAIRFSILCAKYKQPFNSSVTKLFSEFAISHKTSITFDSSLAPIENPKPIIGTLLFEPNITILQFDNFCPECIGFIIAQALKKLKSLRSIVLMNYPSIQFNQINFDKIENPSVVSWKFCNCFSLSNFGQLGVFFTQFSEYPGDIQSLTLQNCTITMRNADRISTSLQTSRCFRLLEVLRFDDISTEQKAAYKVFSQLQEAVQKIPSIRYYSCSNWTPQISFLPTSADTKFKIIRSSSLTHINFSKCNLSKVLGTFVFPSNITAIILQNSTFSAISLRNMLNSISQLKNKIYLDVSGYKMTEDESRIFNSGLQDIKPLTNIVELHWSRNSFTLETAEQFARIFLRSPHIKYIGLSGIFNKNNLNIMETLITAISESPIWGLEIEGTQENRLGDKIFDLMKSVKKIHKLKSLDIIGHNFSDSAAVTFLKGIKFMKSLSELSIDKTNLNNKTSVYGFYNNIMVIPFLKSFYPPVCDIKNVMEKDVFVHQHGLHHEKFFGRYVNFSKPTNIYTRMFFYSNSIDMTKLYDYSNKFPIYLFKSPSDDPLYLMSPNATNCGLFSLWTFPLISKNENLSIAQKSLFISPFSVPHKAPVSHEFMIPHVLHKAMGRHTYLFDQNEKVPKFLNNSENFQQIEITNDEQNNNVIKLIKINNNDNMIQNNFNTLYDIEEIQDQINAQHSIFPEDLDRTINSLNYINKICFKISNDRKIDVEEITVENPTPISVTFSADPELSEMSKKLCKTIYTKSEMHFPESKKDDIVFEVYKTERTNNQQFIPKIDSKNFNEIFSMTHYINDEEDSFSTRSVSTSGFLSSAKLAANISPKPTTTNEEFIHELMEDNQNPNIFVEVPDNDKSDTNSDELSSLKTRIYHFETLKTENALDTLKSNDALSDNEIPDIMLPRPLESFISPMKYNFGSQKQTLGKPVLKKEISDEDKIILSRIDYQKPSLDDIEPLRTEVGFDSEEIPNFSQKEESSILELQRSDTTTNDSEILPPELNTDLYTTGNSPPEIPMPIPLDEIEMKQIPYFLATDDDMNYPFVDIPLPKEINNEDVLDLYSSEVSNDIDKGLPNIIPTSDDNPFDIPNIPLPEPIPEPNQKNQTKPTKSVKFKPILNPLPIQNLRNSEDFPYEDFYRARRLSSDFPSPLATSVNESPFRPDLPSPKPLSPNDLNNPFLTPLSTTNNDKPLRPDLPSPKPLSPYDPRSPFYEPLSTTNNDKPFRPDLPSPKPLSPYDQRNPFLNPLSTTNNEKPFSPDLQSPKSLSPYDHRNPFLRSSIPNTPPRKSIVLSDIRSPSQSSQSEDENSKRDIIIPPPLESSFPDESEGKIEKSEEVIIILPPLTESPKEEDNSKTQSLSSSDILNDSPIGIPPPLRSNVPPPEIKVPAPISKDIALQKEIEAKQKKLEKPKIGLPMLESNISKDKNIKMAFGTSLPVASNNRNMPHFVIKSDKTEDDDSIYIDPWLLEKDSDSSDEDTDDDEYPKPTKIVIKPSYSPLIAFGFVQEIPL